MTKESMTKEIIIENDGPIKQFRFTVPEQGGVVELLGWHGVGKSHALNAIQQTITHGKDVPPRDGASAAEVEVFGITARFGRRSTFTGDLECEILDGRFDLGDIIDPGRQDPKAADSRRIKALIQLATGEETAKPELFYELLPGGKEEFEQEVSLRAQSETDIVNMAAQIKRDLEAAARRDAELAQKARLSWETAKRATAEVDLNAPDDEKALAAAHEAAVKTQGSLETEATSINAVLKRAEEAQQKLNDQNVKGSKPAEIEFILKRENVELARLLEEKATLEEKLKQVGFKLQLRKKSVESAENALRAAVEQQDLIAAWQADIDEASKLKPIPVSEITAAQERVVEARRALETGALVRSAKRRLTEAEADKQIAKELEAKSISLRSAAQATDIVLSKIVQQLNCPLYVSRGRVVTQTDRGEELFSDLSDGERVNLVMEIAINAVKQPGKNGLLVIGQRHWQDLNPATRLMIAEAVEGTGVVVVTGRATDDRDLIARRLEVEPALSIE